MGAPKATTDDEEFAIRIQQLTREKPRRQLQQHQQQQKQQQQQQQWGETEEWET